MSEALSCGVVRCKVSRIINSISSAGRDLSTVELACFVGFMDFVSFVGSVSGKSESASRSICALIDFRRRACNS